MPDEMKEARKATTNDFVIYSRKLLTMTHKEVRELCTRCQSGRDTHVTSLELLLAKILDRAIVAADISKASFILDRVCGKVLQLEEGSNVPTLMLNYSPEYLKRSDEK
jgi:sirohydrochlorin ferrochelatase